MKNAKYGQIQLRIGFHTSLALFLLSVECPRHQSRFVLNGLTEGSDEGYQVANIEWVPKDRERIVGIIIPWLC